MLAHTFGLHHKCLERSFNKIKHHRGIATRYEKSLKISCSCAFGSGHRSTQLRTGLVYFSTRIPNHVSPFLCLRNNELAKFGRGKIKCITTQICKPGF
jgi:hypothetical protein